MTNLEEASAQAQANKLELKRLELQLDRTARTIGNLQTIIKVLAAVVTVSFGAGVYVATLAAQAAKVSETVSLLEGRVVLAEQALAKQDAVNTETRQLAAASFRSLTAGIVPVGDPLPSTEPESNGGGTKPICAAGSMMIGLQLFKDTNGQRTIWIQCGKLGDVALN